MTEAQRESLCDLIRQAGAHAQALRDAGLQVDKKSRQDFVSQADLAVEQQIKGWLQAHFPRRVSSARRAVLLAMNRPSGCSTLSMAPPTLSSVWITGVSRWHEYARPS